MLVADGQTVRDSLVERTHAFAFSFCGVLYPDSGGVESDSEFFFFGGVLFCDIIYEDDEEGEADDVRDGDHPGSSGPALGEKSRAGATTRSLG